MYNEMKEKIQRGEPVLGVSVMIPSPQLVEMIGRIGYDWVLIDCEHGSISIEMAEYMIMAAEAAGVVPIIRPCGSDPEIIGQYMDCGAKGIQAPHVCSAEEAEAIVDAVKYGPDGERGLAVGTRSAGYGFDLSMKDYTKRSNDNILVCIQIEDKEAVDHIKEITAVKGIDVFFVGPSDLSQSLGHPGDIHHPDVEKTIDGVFQYIHDAGKASGTAGNMNLLPQRLEQGILYYYVHLTTLLSHASKEIFQEIGQK